MDTGIGSMATKGVFVLLFSVAVGAFVFKTILKDEPKKVEAGEPTVSKSQSEGESSSKTKNENTSSSKLRGDVPQSGNWHQVLNVSAGSSIDDIRQAYKKLMSQYHPDKVASLGKELRDLAEKKTKAITLAYRQAMHERGAAI